MISNSNHLLMSPSERVAYACESVRTHPEVLKDLCTRLNFEPLLLKATDKEGRAIYHTNVFMSITTKLCVICLEALEAEDRQQVVDRMEKSGRKVVNISQQQVQSLAGNCYEVIGEDGNPKLIISTRFAIFTLFPPNVDNIFHRAWSSLRPDQKKDLEGSADIVQCKVDTIEKVGGGGIRCMLAGIFAERKRK